MLAYGSFIRQLRFDKKLTQYDIENRTGIRREYLSKIENNKLPNPTLDTITNIVNNGFGIELHVFFNELHAASIFKGV